MWMAYSLAAAMAAADFLPLEVRGLESTRSYKGQLLGRKSPND
jgi:hypothetical protein